MKCFAPSSLPLVFFSSLIIVVSLIAIILLSIFYPSIWLILLFSLIILFFAFVIWSFRNPIRTIKQDSRLIISPADGKISEIKVSDKGFSVTILMSPFDVHMNRSPIDAVVQEVTFKKGSHWPVYFNNYARRNQRNIIELVNDEKQLFVKVIQVSGIFARRTISYVSKGDKVKQGELIGTIRFGSITHIEVQTTKKYKILVDRHSKVKAGLTPLAEEIE